MMGNAATGAPSIITVEHSGVAGHTEQHTFRVSGSPYTPKYYGSFQLQDEQHASAPLLDVHKQV